MWLISVTEHVAEMRERMIAMFAHPDWIKGVRLDPFIDYELLRMRGRYAKAAPGVEIQ